MKGFEIISESMVNKIHDLYGKNMLLSMLYQVGASPGAQISERIKRKYAKEDFGEIEAFIVLLKELKEFYSIKIREIEQDDEKIRLIIENNCFLREPFKHREKLKFGKAFCRINKGYFETALKKLIGKKVKKIDINFLENDEEKDACVEEIIFYKQQAFY